MKIGITCLIISLILAIASVGGTVYTTTADAAIERRIVLDVVSWDVLYLLDREDVREYLEETGGYRLESLRIVNEDEHGPIQGKPWQYVIQSTVDYSKDGEMYIVRFDLDKNWTGRFEDNRTAEVVLERLWDLPWQRRSDGQHYQDPAWTLRSITPKEYEYIVIEDES